MKILIIAAHPDDEILGIGGSIAKWAASGNKVDVKILAEGSTSRDLKEIVNSDKMTFLILDLVLKKLQIYWE